MNNRHIAVVALVFLCVGTAQSHVGDVVYPIAELTDEMLAQVDVRDGLPDEWLGLIGEPTMTALDFRDQLGSKQPNPGDLDFRIWLGWHAMLNRIYVAIVLSDDIYENSHDYASDELDNMPEHDSVSLSVDGNHSGGGDFNDCFRSGCSDEQLLELDGQTQLFTAIAHTASGPTVDLPITRLRTSKLPWMLQPPFAEGGGSASGEAPNISVIEFYVTPFDQMVWHSAEESLPSDLVAGGVIGFGIVVHDNDRDFSEDEYWVPREMPASPDIPALVAIWSNMGDRFLDGLLIPIADTGVSQASWGRIKTQEGLLLRHEIP